MSLPNISNLRPASIFNNLTNNILKIKLSNDLDYRYIKVMHVSSDGWSLTSPISLNFIFIHCLDLKINKEIYININYIVDILENDMPEFI